MTSKVTYTGALRTKCTHLASGNEFITDAPFRWRAHCSEFVTNAMGDKACQSRALWFSNIDSIDVHRCVGIHHHSNHSSDRTVFISISDVSRKRDCKV